MGAGKSCVGALLAARLGRTFVDLDARIEAACGATIAQVFERDGEAAFRAMERDSLAQALDVPAVVVATGGGVVLDARNREALAGCAVVHLHAGVDTQLQRLRDDAARPLLAVADRAGRLHALAAERGALYAEVARVRVDTDALDAAAVADAVLESLGEATWAR